MKTSWDLVLLCHSTVHFVCFQVKHVLAESERQLSAAQKEIQTQREELSQVGFSWSICYWFTPTILCLPTIMGQTGDFAKDNKQSWFCWVTAFISRSGSNWVTWQSELREWQRTGSLRQRSVRLGCDTERHPAPHLAVLDRLFSTNYGCLKTYQWL